MRRLLKSVINLYFLFKNNTKRYIVDLGERADNYNSRESVKRYLLKGYTVEEIASMTPMTLDEVSSHARYWMGGDST